MDRMKPTSRTAFERVRDGAIIRAMEARRGSRRALRVRAELPGNDHVALEALVADSYGRLLDTVRLRTSEGAQQADADLLGPGVYQVTVRGVGAGRTHVIPVTTAVLARAPESSFYAGDLT